MAKVILGHQCVKMEAKPSGQLSGVAKTTMISNEYLLRVPLWKNAAQVLSMTWRRTLAVHVVLAQLTVDKRQGFRHCGRAVSGVVGNLQAATARQKILQTRLYQRMTVGNVKVADCLQSMASVTLDLPVRVAVKK